METEPPKNKGGRPLGSASKMAKESRERAQATGLLPHEILLSIARGEPQPEPVIDPATGKTVKMGYVVADLEQRKGAAQAAAPYFAPRIQAVEVTHGMTDDALDQLIASLATETGTSLGFSGEGEAPALPSPTTRRRKWTDEDDADGN